MRSLDITPTGPLIISHLSRVDIGVPIQLKDTAGAIVDLVATNPPVLIAVVPAGTEDPTSALVAAVWHSRPDDAGIVRAFADLNIGPDGDADWPDVLGDCDTWFQVTTSTQVVLDKTPGRIVLT